jgi:RNA polymerase sigma-70 factor (ECF subfamily)
MQNEARTYLQDLDTAQRIAAGDMETLDRFYEQWAGATYAFIFNQMDRNKMETEEILQEVWLSALHGMGAYSGQSSLFTWLCSIARHKISDFYRRQGRQYRMEPDSDPDVIEALRNDTPLPEEMLARQSTRLMVVKAMALLPQEYRQALTTRYIDECSVVQVAAQLGKTYKATESLLSRARTALQAAIIQMEAPHDGE